MKRMNCKHLVAGLFVMLTAIFIFGCCQHSICSSDDEFSEDKRDFPEISQKELDSVLPLDKIATGIFNKMQAKTDTSVPLFGIEGLWAQGYVFPRDPFNEDDEDARQEIVFVHILPDNANMPRELRCVDGTASKFSLVIGNMDNNHDITNGSRLAVLCTTETDSATLHICSDHLCRNSAVFEVNLSTNGFGRSCFEDAEDGEVSDAGVVEQVSTPYDHCPTWGLVSAKNPEDLVSLKKDRNEPITAPVPAPVL